VRGVLWLDPENAFTPHIGRYGLARSLHRHARQPRVSALRSIFALTEDRDRAYFGRGDSHDQIGIIDKMRAVFGRSYAAEPDRLVEELTVDEAIAEADMREIARDKKTGRAEALRRAVLAMIDGSDAREAHPAYWASFVVVGKGAR
jgi:hypothetical protein